jgi:hypothetical protein
MLWRNGVRARRSDLGYLGYVGVLHNRLCSERPERRQFGIRRAFVRAWLSVADWYYLDCELLHGWTSWRLVLSTTGATPPWRSRAQPSYPQLWVYLGRMS